VKASSRNGVLCTLLSLDPPEVEIICKMCFREFPTFKFFKISGISQKGPEYMVFIPFSCSLDNFQYLIVCNVPFLLDVFTCKNMENTLTCITTIYIAVDIPP